VEVPPLQFSVGNVVIPDSGWSDPMAESSEGLRTIYTDTKLETVDTDNDGLKLLRHCSTRRGVWGLRVESF